MKIKSFLQPWFLILISGLLLFLFTQQSLIITGNPNYFPTMILLGAFVVPVAFVTYFYDYVRHREISMPLLTTCFVVGGILGSIAAGVLESATLLDSSLVTMFGIGIIEELAKLLFPVAMYIGWRYRHEADGLLFGVAAGMGFAGLETMGYAMVTLFETQGDIFALQQVLFLRGLLSPAGHAAWTGFFCAVLWSERAKKGHAVINGKVIGAFLMAVVLHALWNIAASFGGQTSADIISTAGTSVLIVISLTLLIRRYKEAKKALNNATT
jgi:protease PrsW